MKREISRRAAISVIIVFTLGALVVGANSGIPEEARVAIAFPVLIAGLLISLKEITTHKSVSWETAAGSLLAVIGSVLLGYQAIANAKQNSTWAVLIISVAVLALFFLVPLAVNFFLRKPK